MKPLLAAAVAVILFLTYVWPYAVSADPADPYFRHAAIGAFVAFFAALFALACKALRTSS